MSAEEQTFGKNLQNEESEVIPTEKVEETCPNTEQLQKKLAECEALLLDYKNESASLKNELQLKTEESDNHKKKATSFENELKKLLQSQSQNGNPKHKSEDMVTQAKSVIFEKTKVCKNQELQIEALTQQVASLKEIVGITKDMLDIRNFEVKQLQEKLECMNLKFSVEKERLTLMHNKMDKMIQLNIELKQEYENQLKLFTSLQKGYKEREKLTLANGDTDLPHEDTPKTEDTKE